ncbi:MAG: molecular chaperone TorD family protein [Gammaproteobacteria bacterium]|nr:MAG: molecular chaperone TorD family protein [Gammaproteobacteria bacterium]
MDAPTSGADVDEANTAACRATERSNLYGFLAAVYREEPTPGFLRHLRDPSFLQVLAAAGVVLDRDLLRLPEEELVSELALEHTRLFLGPGKHVSPHASVHLPEGGGSLYGAPTVAVKRFIESTGVQYRPDYGGLPDHISVELEFMQQVVLAEAAAWGSLDCEQARTCLSVEKEFLDTHLAGWVPIFCEKVCQRAELSFYWQMAQMTQEFLRMERDELEETAQQDLLQ